MIHASSILVIAGSVRPTRISVEVATWIAGVGEATLRRPFEVVDLKDWPLPMDDEPAMPHGGDYAQPHTHAWSRKVAEAAGVVFVSPQYNAGYPAALKNAIDHLYPEWRGKPAAIVTYGGHGGAFASDQLKQVADRLHMALAETRPQFMLPRMMIEANTGEIDPVAVFGTQVPALQQALAELGERIAAVPAAPQGG